ncbi:MAG: DUF1501 domain-containing protein [Rhodothermales bacterium]|nr:DUF1501 domain-containing protein [Rhodothermales bacterium]
MSHRHDHDHNVVAEACRHGACIEHGSAHAADHRAWSRRNFLSRMGLAAGGAAFMLNGRPITAFGRNPFLNAIQQADTDRVLILIQMNGGNDGLNTIIPVNNDIYYNSRPTIAIPKAQSILLDDETGLHPAMSGLQDLWGNGNMAVVHNVGYGNQTRSHFEGTVNWSTARNQGNAENTGWLARYLTEEFPNLYSNPVDYPLAVRVGGPATIFQGQSGNLSVTFGDAQDFERFLSQGGFYDTEGVPSTTYGDELAFVRSVTNASFRYVQAVQDAADVGTNLVDYPNSGLSNSLAVVARMLRGGLPTNLYTVSRGGFDTHSNQGGATGGHANMLGDIASAVQSFFDDLAQDGLDSRVLVMTFSEFGRTLNENGSRGTDHGAGAPLMVFSRALNGGLYGEQSNLTDLYGGDPRYTTDYRDVYWTIAKDWFGMDESQADTIVGDRYANLGFVNEAYQTAITPREEPQGFHLSQNYPNPFNPSTTIAFQLAQTGRVKLSVFDVHGRQVSSLVDDYRPAGQHVVDFDGRGLPSGTYVYRLETASGVESRKMVLLK